MKFSNLCILLTLLAMSCRTQENTVASESFPRMEGQRNGPPSIEEIFKMDANGDGKLAKDEINGPLLRDFTKIDSDKDGYITRAELESAPKPQHGRPPRN